MKGKIWIVFLVIIVIALLLVILYQIYLAPTEDKVEVFHNYQTEQELVRDFMNSMKVDGMVVTNYLDTERNLPYSTGHEVLLESIGLQLEIAILEKDLNEYLYLMKKVSEYFLVQEEALKWRVFSQEDTNITATIDTLRVIDAIFEAEKAFNDSSYIDLAHALTQYLTNTMGTYLPNDSDPLSGHTSDLLDLSYIDLSTLSILLEKNIISLETYERHERLLLDNRIKPGRALFERQYNMAEDGFTRYEKTYMIDNVLVLLHLAEVDEMEDSDLEWLKNQFRDYGYISAEYNEYSEPVSQIESTAIYAMIALIAAEKGDQELYLLSLDKMLTLQVTDKNSSIYGSFGNPENNEVYSYDNLLAYLALLRGDSNEK